MKKYLLLLLPILLCATILLGCARGENDSMTKATDDGDLLGCARGEKDSMIRATDDGDFVLTLPISGEEVTIYEDYSEYVEYISETLVREAEEAIMEIKRDPSYDGGYDIIFDGENLYLSFVGVRNFEPAGTGWNGEMSGCNIDHEHIQFDYIITVDKIR